MLERPLLCLCLHHRCGRKPIPRFIHLCELCGEARCEAPEWQRVEALRAFAPSPRCSSCGAPWHPATGHVDRLERVYCWNCTLGIIEAIKQYDWTSVPKGLRASATVRWRGRALVRPVKFTAVP